MSCDPAGDAKSLIDSLTQGVDFNIPVIDMSGDDFKLPDMTNVFSSLTKLTNDDLTQKSLTGSGTFDVIMASMKLQLKAEYEQGRITGDAYAKAFISLVQTAASTAVQYLLSRDQSFWQSQNAQIAAMTAKVSLETEKVRYAAMLIEAQNEKANYALTELKAATESVQYCTAQYNLNTMLPTQKALLDVQTTGEELKNQEMTYNLSYMLPAQKSLLDSQVENQEAQTDISKYNLSDMLPSQKALIDSQKDHEDAETASVTYTTRSILPAQAALVSSQKLHEDAETASVTYSTANILPSQASLLDKQVVGQTDDNLTKEYNLQYILPQQWDMLKEQTETQRAQTLDTRTDGTTVAGTVGKQKALYSQQIISYQRDAETKAAKLYTDAWTVMKTSDDGLNPPNGFTNANLDVILTSLQTKNGLTG